MSPKCNLCREETFILFLFRTPAILLHHLLSKLWQRRMVEWEVKGFEDKSGKEEGWVCREDLLA